MNATYLAFAAAVALLIASPDRWSPWWYPTRAGAGHCGRFSAVRCLRRS